MERRLVVYLEVNRYNKMSGDISLIQAMLFTNRIFGRLQRSYTIGNKCRVDELLQVLIMSVNIGL